MLSSTAIRVLAVVLAAAATVTVRPSAAPAAPSLGFDAETRARMLAQEPLKQAASIVRDAIPTVALSGHAGIVLDDGHVTLWWKGQLPAAVHTAIAAARRIAPVQVRAAQHSRAELRAAAETIGAYIKAHPDTPHHSVNLSYDGSGLTVITEPSGGRAATQATLPADLPMPAGIPVRVLVEPRPIDTWGRYADTSPFYAGARIRELSTGENCTSGWGVTGADGWSYMVTAGHCGRLGSTWWNGSQNVKIGVAAREERAHDILLISTQTAGRMYDGAADAAEFTKRVNGWQSAYPGEWLCTSGATSRALCNYRVSGEFQYTRCGRDPYNNWHCYSDLVLADRFDSIPASRGGDSGGPVFSIVGQDRVMAKGIISGVRENYRLIFQDFETIQRDFNVTIRTI